MDPSFKDDISQKLGDANPPPSSLNVILMIVIPVACLLVAWIGLSTGKTIVIEATRVSKRVTETLTREQDGVTLSAKRLVDPGRVDVVIYEKILGWIQWKRHVLELVTDARASSSSEDVRDIRGRRTSSTSSESLVLKTSAGQEWRSANVSFAIGKKPGAVAAELSDFIQKGEEERLLMKWTPLLGNIIGVPFALLAILMFWGIVKMLIRKIFE